MSRSASSKSDNKNSEREVCGEAKVHGQREVRGGRGELTEFSPAKPGVGSASIEYRKITHVLDSFSWHEKSFYI